MPPPHTHLGCDEAYFVLDGIVTFVLDGTGRIAGAETVVLVPGGTGHTFGNRSEEPARHLVIHTPALDAYFAELEQVWRGPTAPTVEEERALMDGSVRDGTCVTYDSVASTLARGGRARELLGFLKS